jgi:hypothetical protein
LRQGFTIESFSPFVRRGADGYKDFIMWHAWRSHIWRSGITGREIYGPAGQCLHGVQGFTQAGFLQGVLIDGFMAGMYKFHGVML